MGKIIFQGKHASAIKTLVEPDFFLSKLLDVC